MENFLLVERGTFSRNHYDKHSFSRKCVENFASDYDGIGEKVQKRLLELEPKWSGNLIMVANKYADVSKWEDAARLRMSVRARRQKKMAGESCIEVEQGHTILIQQQVELDLYYANGQIC